MFSIRDGITYDDILIVPKHSDIDSRDDVDISVDINGIKYSHPIIPANMQSVTGEKMSEAVIRSGGLAILHRFMPVEEQLEIINNFYIKCNSALSDLSYSDFTDHFAISVGVKGIYKEYIKQFSDKGIKIFCIDIAHGDSKHGVDMTQWIRKEYPNSTIISGNVATGSGAYRLWDCGANVVKCGVGPGCFAAGTRILMANGFYKNIEDVQINDYVINKDGKPVKVLNSFCTGTRNVVKLRNNSFYIDTYVTPDHKFFVSNNKSKKWKQVQKLKNETFLLPKNINFALPETFNIPLYKKSKIDSVITPNYYSGYLFGSLLRNEKPNSVMTWNLNPDQEHIALKIRKSIKKIFNKDVSFSKTTKLLQVKFHYKPLSNFLDSFGNKQDKHLPNNLLVNNKQYLRGLYRGLLDNNCLKNSENTSKYIVELFDILNYLLVKEFPNNKIRSNNYFVVKNLGYEDTNTEVPVYDLTVDCDTHSFIANNMIVHNSLCTTRIETGAGVPQITALMDIVNEKEKHYNKDSHKYIIADGGIRNSGDCVKSLCFADMVMTGNIFSGCVESPGQVISIKGSTYKEYRGSSTHKSKHIEGVVAIVPTKGKFENILKKLLEGISSGLSYQGSRNLAELKEDPEFIRITSAGMTESTPHDVLF